MLIDGQKNWPGWLLLYCFIAIIYGVNWTKIMNYYYLLNVQVIRNKRTMQCSHKDRSSYLSVSVLAVSVLTAALSLSNSCDSSNRNDKHTETHCPLLLCLCCYLSNWAGSENCMYCILSQQPPTPQPLLLTSPVSCQGNPSFHPSFRFLHLKASIFSPLLPFSLPFSPLSLVCCLSFI